MKELIRILHLSDLHFREEKKDESKAVLISLGDTIARMAKETKGPDFVVITGDLVWSGRNSDYNIAQEWINEHLLKPIKGFQKERLLIIPGNHDVNRAKIDQVAEYIKRGFREGNQGEITKILNKNTSRKILLKSHKDYLNFANHYRSSDKHLKVPWWSQVCRCNGALFGFAGLATSLIAYGEDKHDYGNLVLSDYQIDNVFQGLKDSNIKIALIHHPVSYLIGEERRKIQRYLLGNCSLVFRGHLHEQDTLLYKTPDDHMVELATGSGYHNRDYQNTFEVIDIDTNKRKVLVQYWIWHKDRWIVDRNAYQTTTGSSEFPLRVFNESEMKKYIPSRTNEKTRNKEAKNIPCEFVKLPLNPRSARKLSDLLAVIQRNIYKELKKKYTNLKSKQIRANVFLPDYHGVKEFGSIKLYIPDYFRVNMNYAPEWNIKFPPNRGATGVTFIDGKARYTKRISRGKGDWESKLKMTPALKKEVHKDLKWIFSIPLTDPSDNNVILGVMNIDGLDYVVHENDITAAISKYFVDLYAFMLYLSKRPRQEVILSGE